MATYTQVINFAKEYDLKLESTDPRFRNYVSVHSKIDSTNMFFQYAFVLLKGNFSIVFTEHNRYHIFNLEDYTVNMYKLIDIERV